MSMKRFLDITDFSREELRETLNQMSFFKDNKSVYANDLNGKCIVTAFYDDNQFTKMAFSSAVAKMGGTVIPFEKVQGVTFKDEVMAMASVSEAIVISHPKKGAARAASLYSKVPVINAGDGGRAYPVRTLADLSSVWLEKHHVSNMKIGFLGDFTDNACVKSLMQCLNLYKGNEFYFISVNGKPLSKEYTSLMERHEKKFSVYDNLFEVLPELDVLYMTPVFENSFPDKITYESRKHKFILDERMLLTAKEDLIILHPMPRNEELDPSIDNDMRAKYFDCMNTFCDACSISLVKTVSQKPTRYIEPMFEKSTHDCHCGRADCITSQEEYLPNLFYETDEGKLICKYCGGEYKANE